VEYLYPLGLAEQAHILIKPTDRAAPQLFNPREGRGGLALIGVHPIKDGAGTLLGATLSIYMFNNDFTLVDQIRDVAGIDSVTVFFGDLRVSTNVLNADGTRAVGTRVSQDVFDTVLVQGSEYQGRAFVVNEWYTTRYEPLRNHLGKVVGSLYVGMRVSGFEALMSTFNRQVALIALVSIVLAGIIAIPITRVITRPIEELLDANRRLARGNMTVRVDDFGPGELGELGRSFNTMVETLNRIQQELLHKEKLASVGQLSAGVAHEINNPLASILLFSEMMYKDCEADDPRRDDLAMIINETKRCKIIVADLLNFARQQEVMAQSTHLPELLDQTIDLVSHLPSYKGVEIERRYSPDISVIQGDPEQLQQVFTNLLNNAAEAMPQGGTITVDLRRVDRDSIEVRISDTGAGIPPQNMSQLFTPFFTTKGPGKGTGLGLSISYGIIKMHRGQIQVQSQEGMGTTFTVTLPTQLPDQRLAMNENLIG
jgi:two-component system NtrC family sensor kinase